MIKIFGIGNILLSDDSIGVHVAEAIKDEIENMVDSAEVFVGETDYFYCIDNINKDNFVIIIDSSYFNNAPGTVKKINIKEYYKVYKRKMMMGHDENLPEAMLREGLKNDGVIIMIEGVSFELGIGMSCEIKEKFKSICNEIISIIIQEVR